MKVIARSTPSWVVVHLVGTDGLRDAAGLARDDVGLADRVEQAGLAVVDVTHDGDDRRPGDELVLVDLVLEKSMSNESSSSRSSSSGLTICTS